MESPVSERLSTRAFTDESRVSWMTIPLQGVPPVRLCLRISFVAVGIIAATITQATAQTRPTGGTGGRPPATNGGTGQRPANASPAAGAYTSGDNVALIDILATIRGHVRHKQALEALNKSRGELEAEKQAATKVVNTKKEALQKMSPGTPEFRAAEEELAKLGSELNVELGLKNKGLNEREAQIYLTTYLDIQEAVKEFAQRNRISLVLRFDQKDPDPNNPDSVKQAVMGRAVIFQDKLDITDLIISTVNPAVAKRPTGGDQGTKQPSRSVPK